MFVTADRRWLHLNDAQVPPASPAHRLIKLAKPLGFGYTNPSIQVGLPAPSCFLLVFSKTKSRWELAPELLHLCRGCWGRFLTKIKTCVPAGLLCLPVHLEAFSNFLVLPGRLSLEEADFLGFGGNRGLQVKKIFCMCPESERKALSSTQPLGSEKLSEENLPLHTLTWGNLRGHRLKGNHVLFWCVRNCV